MIRLPEFLPIDSTSEEVSDWLKSFFKIIEELSDNWEVCDERALVSELQKIDASATEKDIWEYTLEVDLGGMFPTPEQVNSIEMGLEGTCFRTDGPDVLWDDVEGVPTGPWKGSVAIIGPSLQGGSFEEIQQGVFWKAWEDSMDRLIELCEENGLPVVYNQDMFIGNNGVCISLIKEED